jgi:hypothetical protein
MSDESLDGTGEGRQSEGDQEAQGTHCRARERTTAEPELLLPMQLSPVGHSTCVEHSLHAVVLYPQNIQGL